MPKVFSQYIKNVVKSTGYAINDIAHSMAPNFFEMKDDAKSVAEDLYRQIKEFSGPSSDKGIISKTKDTVNDVFKNMLEDISTGKFYNKERSDALMTDVAKSMGMDFGDFDMDFGDDWGFDDNFDSEDVSDDNIIKADRRNTRDTIVAIDTVGARISSEIGQATTASAKMVATANLNATRALYALNQKGFSQVTEGIIGVNNSITSLGAFMAPLSEHFQNSTKFFAETTKTLNNINENLTAILKNTTPSPEATSNKYKQSKNTLASLLSGGTFSFSSYKEMVKTNFKEATYMLSILEDMGLGNLLKSGNAGKNFSPMSMLFTAGLKKLIPSVFETAVKTLDENITNYIAGAMAKASSKYENNYGLGGILASIFLPKREYQEKLSTGNYIKGKVAWDGKSRKALIEVIPTYLSKILASIQGTDKEYRYDYDTGKFVDYKDIKAAKDRDLLNRARSAFGPMYTEAANSIGTRNKANAHMHDQLDKFILAAFRKGGGYWDIMKDIYDIKSGTGEDIKKHNEKAKKLRKELGLTGKDEDVELLISILRDNLTETDKKGNKRFKTSYAKVPGSVEIARNNMANSVKEMSMSGDSLYTNLYNNSYAMGRNHTSEMKMKKNATDFGKLSGLYNEKVLKYLEGIYRFTGLYADNIDLLINGTYSTKKHKKKGIKTNRLTDNIDFNNISNDIEIEEDENDEFKGMSDAQLRIRGNADIAKNREKNVRKTVSELTETYFGSNWKGAPRAGVQFLRAPFEAATNFFTQITNGFNEFLWGDPNKSEKGVFSRMIDKIDNSLDNLFKEGIGNTIKEGFKNFRDYLFGKDDKPGFFNKFFTNSFNELKNVGRWFGNTAKSFLYTPVFGKDNKNTENNGTAAEGRQVTKSGIVTVSEGEMIIPSEFNPYYHGKTNKSQQIANEKKIERGYLGSFAKGDKQSNRLNNRLAKKFQAQQNRQAAFADVIEEHDKKKDKTIRYFRTDDGWVNFDDIKTGAVLKGTDHTGTEVQYYKSPNGNIINTAGSVMDTAKRKVKEAYTKVSNGIAALFSSDDLTDEERLQKEANKQIRSIVAKEIGSEAKQNNGAIGAGALIGGVGSFFTGGLLGPIGGAAIGAAAGLVVRSKKVQDILFGKLGTDENGKETRSGGLINREVATFLQQHGANIGKGAIFGGLGGTVLMGSPVAGIILGGAAGFLKSSEEFQDKLFGARDSNGNRIDNGVISFAMQDYIKKNVPKAVAGGLIGYLTKPVFGSPLLSMVFGSAIGLASSSERFKNFLLGEMGPDGKRHGGLINDIKTKIFYNIDDIAHNLFSTAKSFGRDLTMKIVDTIRDVTSSIGLKIAGSMRKNRVGNWLLDRIEGLTSGAVNFVGNTLGRINRNSKRRQLREGRSLYDRRVHRYLTAEERQKMRGIVYDEDINDNADNYTKADQAIASIKTKEDYDMMQYGLADLLKNKRTGKSTDKRTLSRLYSRLGLGKDITEEQKNKIINLIKSDKPISDEDINDILGISEGGLDQDKMNAYKQFVLEAKADYGKRANNENTKKATEILKKYGIDADNLSKKEMAHIQSLLKDEKVRFTDEKDKENKELTFRDRMIGVATDISTNIAAITATVTKTTPATDYTTQTQEAFKNENKVFKKENGAVVKEVLGTEIELSPRKAQDALRQQQYEDLAKYNRKYETDKWGIFKHQLLTDEQQASNKRVEDVISRGIVSGMITDNSTSADYKTLFEKYGIANDPWAQAYLQDELDENQREALDMRTKKYTIGNRKGKRNFFNNLFNKEKIAKKNKKKQYKKDTKKAIERHEELEQIEADLKDIENEIISHPDIPRDDPKMIEILEARRSLWRKRDNLLKELGLSEVDTEGMSDKEELDYIANMDLNDSIIPTRHAYGFKGILSKGEAIVPGMNSRQAARSASIQANSSFMIESILDRQTKNIILADKYVTHMDNIIKGNASGYNDNSTNRKFISSKGNVSIINSGDKDAGTTETYIDFLSGVHQYQRNAQGELVEQTNDRETDSARRRIDNFYNAIINSSKVNTAQLALAGANAGLTAEQLKQLMDSTGDTDDEEKSSGGILTGIGKLLGSIATGIIGYKGISSIFGIGKSGAAKKPNLAQKLLMKFSPKYREMYLKNLLANPENLVLNEGTFEAYQYLKDAKLGIDFTPEELSKYGFKVNADGTYVDAAGKTHNSIMQDSDGVFRDTDTLETINTKVDDVANNLDDVSRGFDSFGATGAGDKAVTASGVGSKTDDIADATRSYSMSGIDKYDDALDAAGNLRTAGKDIKLSPIQRFKNFVGGKLTAVKNSRVGQALSTAVNDAKVGFSFFKNGAVNVWNKITDSKVGKAISATYNKLKSGATTIKNGVKTAISKIPLDKIAKAATIIYVVAMVIGAVIGAINEASKMSDSEIQEFLNNELNSTIKAGFEAGYNSVSEFKNLIQTNSSAAKWFAAHPCGAIIRVNGSTDFSENTNTVYPYMIYAPATYTFFHQSIYEKARMRGPFNGKEFVDNNSNPTVYQYLDYDTSSFMLVGSTRLVHCSTFMVKNFEYFRMYSTGTQSDFAQRFLGFNADTTGKRVRNSLITSASNVAHDILTFGLYAYGDLETKKYIMMDYNYKSNSINNKDGDGVIPFTDPFFSPLSLETPKIDDYANSQLDLALGSVGAYGGYKVNGSNTLVSSGSENIGKESGAADAVLRAKFNALYALNLASTYQDLPEDVGNMYGVYNPDHTTYTGSSLNYEMERWLKDRNQESQKYIENLYDFHKNNKSFSKVFSGKEGLYKHEYGDEFISKNWFDIYDAIADETAVKSNAKYTGFHNGLHHWADGYTSTSYSRPNWSGGRSGIGRRKKYSGGAANFVSQYDPKYANKKISGKSFAELGCGPAVAAMAANANGKKLSVDDAVRMSKDYQDSNGVESDYFNNVLSKKGIETDYTNSPIDMYNRLKEGQPVIMLGSDSTNTNKGASPYGPGSHYVLGKGIVDDKIVVDDPESNGTKLYSTNILKNTKLGIGTGAGSGNVLSNYSGGATGDKEEVQKQVYAWLTSNGYSPATAAGIMGNIEQESGFNPADVTLEPDGSTKAAGLFQWHKYNGYETNPTNYAAMGRFGGMVKLADSNGRDWTDVETQLQYMNKEMNGLSQWLDPKNASDSGIQKAAKGGYYDSKGNWQKGTFNNAGLNFNTDGVSLDQFKQLTNPVLAAQYFEAAFERAGSPNMQRRTDKATEFYNKYSGSTWTGNWNNINYNPNDTTFSTDPLDIRGLSGFNALNSFFFNNDMSVFGLRNNDAIDFTYYNTYSNIPTIVSRNVVDSVTWVTLSNGETMTLSQYNNKYGRGNGDLQKALVAYVMGRLETEIYSQGTEKYDRASARGLKIVDPKNPQLTRFSDCSYFMQQAYKDVANVDIGSYTEAQIKKAESGLGDMFVVFNSKDDVDGALKILQPGDLIYYYSPNSKKSYYKNVSHVEMYVGNNKIAGQEGNGKKYYGSYTGKDGKRYNANPYYGSGPTVKDIRKKSRILMVTRLKDIEKYKVRTTLNGDKILEGKEPTLEYYDRDKDQFIWSNGSKTYTTNLFESAEDARHRKIGNDGKSALHVVEDGANGILWSDGNYIVRDKNYKDKSKKAEKVVIVDHDASTDTWNWNDGAVDRKPNMTQKKEYEEKLAAQGSNFTGGSSKLFKSGKIFDMNKINTSKQKNKDSFKVKTISPTVDKTYNKIKSNNKYSGGASKTPTYDTTSHIIKETKPIGTTSIPTHQFKSTPANTTVKLSNGATLTGIDLKNLEVLLLKLNESLTAIKNNTSVNPTLAASMTAFAAGTNARVNANTRAITKRIEADAVTKRDKQYNIAVENITSQLDSIING